MYDIFIEKLKSVIRSRLFLISILLLLLFGSLINRLFVLQIVEGETYEKAAESKDIRELEIKSTRGTIRDRKGKVLAYNELSYSVTLEDVDPSILKGNEAKNEMIHKLIQIIETNGGTLSNQFYIELDEESEQKDALIFNTDENGILRFKRDVYSRKRVEDLSEEEKSRSAEEVFAYLNEKKYEIDLTKYTLEESLKIMKIRFALTMNSYYKYKAITIATGVNDITVAAIKENRAQLPGSDILQETKRVYKDSKYFSNIIGYTGLITAEILEEYENENDMSYSDSDQVGKEGIEKSFEKELRGIKGSQKVAINTDRRIVDVLKKSEPVAGNDLYLTLDANLQKTCYDLLEKKIADILYSKIVNSMSYGSKGKSADNITIPIYDVYFALINNNVINTMSLNEEDTTELEKSTYKTFNGKQKRVMKELDQILHVKSKTLTKETSKEMQEYIHYIYDEILIKQKILLQEKMDKKDIHYIDYTNEKEGFSEFLQYAISKNWVDLTKLEIEEKFSTNDEIYLRLLDYTKKYLQKDPEFIKRNYKYMIYSNELTGTNICLLLFDQGILKYNKNEIASLKSGSVSAYSFLKGKIKKRIITPGQLALEPYSGSVVVTDVNNGDVLALVSYPSYDNNKLANQADVAYFNRLMVDKASPMLNRATQSKTAPGSTFKPITVVSALAEGVVGENELIRCTGSFDKITPPVKCWHLSGHGNLSAARGIENSCNYYMNEVLYRMSFVNGKYNSKEGLKKLRKYAAMFGLDAESGIELQEVEPQISDTSPERSAMGQGTHNYTASQISRYVTTIANMGTCYNLTILDQIKDINGKVVRDNKAAVYKKPKISKSIWNTIQNGMYLVVNGSHSGSISGHFANTTVKVAGKTGTAQLNKSHPNHALFVSYAPYDKPEISVTTVIPNGYTSSNTAALASSIYRYYFKDSNYKELMNNDSNVSGASAGD